MTTREEKIKALKEKLSARAARKFPGDTDRQKRYIWGTINKVKENMSHAHH